MPILHSSRAGRRGSSRRSNNNGRQAQMVHNFAVTYNGHSHLRILTQWLGSDHKRLLPFCVVNTILAAVLHVCASAPGILLDMSSKVLSGVTLQLYSVMGLVLGILLTCRVVTSLARYNETREYLQMVNMSCRNLIDCMAVYSMRDGGLAAKQWRNEVAYRALLLLRTTVSVVDYVATSVKATELPELGGTVLKDVTAQLPPTRWLHELRSDYEENLRVPVRISFMLRKTIRGQDRRLSPPLPVMEESELHARVNNFMEGYYGILKLMTTPVPFPLIQLTTTFLFLFLFSLVFVLLPDNDGSIHDSTWSLLSHCFLVFVLSYAFLGMELVSLHMDDPFGDDVVDFNNLAIAQTAFEDAYLTISDVDGAEWADNLRFKMHDHSEDPLNSESERSLLMNRYLDV